MEREAFKNSVLAMLNNEISEFKNVIDKALDSGAMNTENESDENFAVRKALIAAIFENYYARFYPSSKEGIKEFKNIRRFL
jgi:hypothetical protein